jgi:ATP-dependent RNA helicase DeaD
MDGLETGDLLGLICDYGEIEKGKIGKIDLKGAFSFFELEKDVTEKVMKGFEGVEVRGRKVRLEMSGDRREGGSSREGGASEGGGYERKKRSFDGPSGGRNEKRSYSGGGRTGGGERSYGGGSSRSGSGGGERERKKRW